MKYFDVCLTMTVSKITSVLNAKMSFTTLIDVDIF